MDENIRRNHLLLDFRRRPREAAAFAPVAVVVFQQEFVIAGGQRDGGGLLYGLKR